MEIKVNSKKKPQGAITSSNNKRIFIIFISFWIIIHTSLTTTEMSTYFIRPLQVPHCRGKPPPKGSLKRAKFG